MRQWFTSSAKTSHYTYNAAGERIMKSYGTMDGVYINGAPQGITFHDTDNFTLYIFVVSAEVNLISNWIFESMDYKTAFCHAHWGTSVFEGIFTAAISS